MTLVAFDFDGTLSDSEMTVLLGEQHGVSDRIADVTERAMNGDIGYADSLYERIALLDGMAESDVETALGDVTLRPGAADLIEELVDAGVYVAILTGGFERGVQKALEREGVDVDTIVANQLLFADGALTGDVEGPLIEGTKDDALDVLLAATDENLDDTIAVGDGANDLPMLRRAGHAIGFDPKPTVEPHCEVVVESMAELRELLVEDGVLD